MGDVDNGGGYAYGLDRVYKGNLYNCPLNFTLNLKLQMELKMQKKVPKKYNTLRLLTPLSPSYTTEK